MHGFNHVFGALSMGVTDEYLPKIILVHKPNNLGHTGLIELIENIIQQQNRSDFALRF